MRDSFYLECICSSKYVLSFYQFNLKSHLQTIADINDVFSAFNKSF